MERLDDRFAQRARTTLDQRRLAHGERERDAGQHEKRRDQVDGGPRHPVRENQRERAGNKARDPISVHVDRRAEPELRIGQNLAPERVEHDVLARGKERDDRRQYDDRENVDPGIQHAEQWYRHEQRQLRDEHPAATAAEQRHRVAVEQRRPEELPRVRELNQREEADRLQVDAGRAQPRGQQVEQQIERQSRRETGEDADEHPPVEKRLAPRLVRARRRNRLVDGLRRSLHRRNR